MKKINGGFFDEEETDSPADHVISAEQADALENGQETTEEYVEDQNFTVDVPEQIMDLSEDEELENDTELVTNARLRLDQGRLYEMVIAHNFFDSVDANEKAIRNVQREIRNFAKERLEVLLGLKPDPKLAPIQVKTVVSQSQFSEVETDLLKRLLSKMSNGATEKVKELPKEAPKKVVSNTIPQIKPQQAQSSTIKPIGAKPVARPLPTKPQAQPTRQTPVQNRPRPIPAEEAPLTKPAASMTVKELQERNKRALERQSGTKATSAKAAPMPSVEQQEYFYANRQARNPMVGDMQRLAAIVAQNKQNKGDY